MSRSLVRLLALLLLVFWAGEIEAGEYDFSIPEAEKKPYDLGGRLELRYTLHGLDEDSAGYRLTYYRDAPGSYTQDGKALAELKGAYRLGILQINLLTHHDFVQAYGDEEWINEIYEAYVSLTPSANFTVEAGKKTILWGKGYAWNPAGFVNRPKDPDDPEVNLEGRNMIGADIIKSFPAGALGNLGLTALLLPVFGDWSNAERGQSGDFNYALKLYLLWKDTDLDFIYLGGPNQPNSYGFDFAKNLAENFEVHGELAFQRDVQRVVLNNAGEAAISREDRFSYLLGLRYLNAHDTTFIAEYYHNGAGYDRSEVGDFFTYQDKAYQQWLSTGNPMVMKRAAGLAQPYFQQRNFGRDYLYLKITQKEPFDILYFNPWVAVILNLQDWSYNLQPGMTYAPVTNLELSFRVNIPIGPAGTEFGEKLDALRPEVRVSYYF